MCNLNFCGADPKVIHISEFSSSLIPHFSLSIQPWSGVKIAISASFSNAFGKLPMTSDKPPAFEKGETSAAANNIFISLLLILHFWGLLSLPEL